MTGNHYNNIAPNYTPGGNNDPYREYWNGICYIRRWKGINMAGNKIELQVRWTVEEQRKCGAWLIHQKWKGGQEDFDEMLKLYNANQ